MFSFFIAAGWNNELRPIDLSGLSVQVFTVTVSRWYLLGKKGILLPLKKMPLGYDALSIGIRAVASTI